MTLHCLALFRCPVHSAPGDASNRGLGEDMVSHLVRTIEPGASYQRNEASGRLSVVTGVRVSSEHKCPSLVIDNDDLCVRRRRRPAVTTSAWCTSSCAWARVTAASPGDRSASCSASRTRRGSSSADKVLRWVGLNQHFFKIKNSVIFPGPDLHLSSP